MWKIKEFKHENKLLDSLQVSNGKVTATLFPNLGGSLQRWALDEIDIIDGISPTEDGLKDYQGTFKSSVLFPFPNRVQDGEYSYGDRKYNLKINDLAFHNAIHGLVHDKSFSYTVQENNSNSLIIRLESKSEGDDPGFPFAYSLNLIYTFESSGSMQLTFEVLNTGFQTFPFGLGWHPYFSSSDLTNSRIKATFKDHFLCPERMIPQEKEEAGLETDFSIGEQSFDDGYTLVKPECSLETPDYILTLGFDTGSEPFVQIYTPDHRNSIAIEPMTCVTDALNNGIGLEALDPGESHRWTIELRASIK